jgi:hypothetical protein
MKIILKPIFDLITGQFTLFNNIVYNYVALAIIGLIAFKVAWEFVGFLYDVGIIGSSSSGSIIHWTVRAIVFVVVFYICSFFIWFIKFIISIPLWVWIIVAVSVLAIITMFVLLNQRKSGVTK